MRRALKKMLLAKHRALSRSHKDQIGFDDIVGTEDHVERGENDFSLSGVAREIINEPVDLTKNPLVIPGWRRRHTELSPDDLITLPVVRHLQQIVVGERPKRGDHRLLREGDPAAQSAT